MSSYQMLPCVGGPFHGKGYKCHDEGGATFKAGGFGVPADCVYRVVAVGLNRVWAVNSLTDDQAIKIARELYF